MRRIAALVLAAVVGAVGILPLVDCYRCLEMERIAAHRCCKSGDGDEAKLDEPCCERIEARVLEARALSNDVRLAAPSLSGPVSTLLLALSPQLIAAPRLAFARGSPPGERLHRLSVVLRV